MTVGPVFWGSYSGELLETIMAVLVAQGNPGSVRRTPSSGDGGVDLLIDDGAGGWHVRQVKGFFGRMTPGRRRQVEKSLAKLLADPRLSKPISRWSLTVPIDPTSGEQEWFEDLTANLRFASVWDGKIVWDGLAAAHPHVIDYYLRDGRGRVEAAAADLLSLTRAQTSAGLNATDLAGHVATLHSLLNRTDPHYRYHFRTGPPPPPAPSDHPPGTVLASSTELDDGSVLTTYVVARHAHAAQDAPVGGNVQVTLYDPLRDIDLREPFEAFQLFGTALDIPDGALTVTIDAPGGLGGTFESVGGYLGPARVDESPSRTRLCATDPEGSAIELRLNHRSVTRGPLGGGEVIATDDHDVLRVTIRFGPPPADDPTPPLQLTFDLDDIRGRPVLDVVPAVRFAAQLTAPNQLQWLEEFGTGTIANAPILDDSCSIPSPLARFIDNLATIQGHVRGTVLVPQHLDNEVATEVTELAELIRNGETHGTWTEAVLSLRDGVDATELLGSVSEGALVHEADWTWEIEGRRYQLGRIHHVFAQARPDTTQPPDGQAIRLVAGHDNSYIQRLGPVRSA